MLKEADLQGLPRSEVAWARCSARVLHRPKDGVNSQNEDRYDQSCLTRSTVMKTGIASFICGFLTLVFSGVAASLPPEGSFRLTVDELVKSDHCRVVRLKVEARAGVEMLALRCEDGSSGSVALIPTLKGKGREGTMTLAAMMCESNSTCHVTTLLESRPGSGTSASGHGSYALPRGATLASMVSVTVTNGLYPLNRPLQVGKRNGEVMRLVVGSWN